MKQKIVVKVPYNAPDEYAVLMDVYAEWPDGASVGTKVKNIHAVNLYAPALVESGAGEALKSIFLTTTTTGEHTEIGFKPFTDAAKKKGVRPWKLVFENKDEFPFLPELKLKAEVRCPMMPVELKLMAECEDKEFDIFAERYVRFEFKFDDGDSGGNETKDQRGLNKWKGFSNKSSFANFKWDREDDLEVLFGLEGRLAEADGQEDLVTGQRRFNWNPPKLLTWKGFCLTRPPRGRHRWKIRFNPLSKDSTQHGLRLEYVCSENSGTGFRYDGWGRTDETASKLWPLKIAPVKNLNPRGDDKPHSILVLSQTTASADALRWGLDCSLPYGKLIEAFTPLGAWNETLAAPYLNSLKTVKGASPGSLVAVFKNEKDFDPKDNPPSQEWLLRYIIEDLSPHAPAHDDPQKSKLTQRDFAVSFRDLQLKEKNRIEVDAELSNFLDHEGKPVRRRVAIEPRATAEEIDCSSGGGQPSQPRVSFSITDLRSADGVERAARIGALDLYFNPDPKDMPAGMIEATLAGLGDQNQQEGQWQLSLDGSFNYSLSGFSPGGQDPTPIEDAFPEEKRSDSIVAPFFTSGDQGGAGTAAVKIEGDFRLVADERNSVEFTHRLTMRLERLRGADAGEDANRQLSFVIVDQNPFLIARVSANLDFTGEIGNWSGGAAEGPSWELVDKRDGFDLILPPQVIGEEFIKDYDHGQTLPLNYKFSPPAVFRASRTPFAQQFSEAPWNIRRLLGYPGQRLPGMSVLSMEFELLYGLTTTIKSDFLRLAELDARLGRLPRFLSKTPRLLLNEMNDDAKPAPKKDDYIRQAYCDYRAEYERRLDLLRARTGLLQAWSPARIGPALSLEEGVSYRFRQTRKVVHPLDRKKQDGIYRPHPEGLRGGVDWGFESLNIYNEVLSQQTPGKGQIVNPSFTALGGNGFQKAVFANDKSEIYSDTFLGRTFFYSLQRLGRIGMLWNPAKHVIIYERSVADSQQFKDESGKWLGHPVVRKLVEYVEILQPERNYPEFGEAPKARGFALGSKFAQKIIHVSGKWGRDIPDGWVVPLYLPGEDPKVYKEPDVYIKLSTSQGRGKEHVWGRITNPEILHFYTSTKSTDGKNTDEWAAVPDIDFPIENLPTVPDPEKVKPQADGDPDATLPDPARVHGGYERFTFHLDTAGQTANLVAERVKESSEAVIENVSLIRRSLKNFTPVPEGEERKTMQAAIEKSVDFRAVVAAQVGSVLKSLGGPLDDALTQFKKEVGDGAAAAQEVYSKLQTTRELLTRRQTEAIERWAVKLWPENRDKLLKQLEEVLKKPPELGLIQQVITDAAQRMESVEVIFDDLQRAISRALGTLEDGYSEIYDLIAEARERLLAALRDGDLAVYRDLAFDTVNRAHQLIVAHISRLGEAYPRLRADLINGLAEAVERSAEDAITGLFPAPSPVFDDLPDPSELNDLSDDESLTAPRLPRSGDPVEIEEWIAMVSVEESLDLILERYAGGLDTIAQHALQIGAEVAKIRQAIDDKLKALGFDGALAQQILNKIKAGATIKSIIDEQRKALDDAKDEIKKVYELARDAIGDFEGTIHQTLGNAKEFAGSVTDQIEAAALFAGNLRHLGESIGEDLSGAYRNLTASAASFVSHALAPYENQIKDVAQRIDLEKIRTLEPELNALRDRSLRLVRAFGEAPIAEAVKLNRERLAYYFQSIQDQAKDAVHQITNAVDFTPATVLLNRVGRELEQFDLKSVGIRLPAISVAEKFLSKNLLDRPVNLLEKLKPDLRDILPDFAGLNLSRLFDGVKFPDFSGDSVHITHGFNPSTLQAWAQCDVDLPLGGEKELFTLGLVKVVLASAHFDAHTRIVIDSKGAPQRSVEATLKSEWKLVVGGADVLMIKDGALRFDNSGHLTFKMEAKNLILNKALKFITDLMSRLRPSKNSGLSFQLVFDGAIPVGVKALLDLALPPLQTGAFSISNLALASHFEVAAPGGEFYLGAGLGISSKERPFNLSVLFLGGGGWFTVGVLYYPFRDGNRLAARLSVGIAAGASFPFDIGVASGGVYFLISVGVEYFYGGGSDRLSILLRISLEGELVVLGIISVGILMALEATYQTGGALFCVGTLRIKIKICWCFKIEVNKSFTLTLAGKSGGSAEAADSFAFHETLELAAAAERIHPVEFAVRNYLASFAE